MKRTRKAVALCLATIMALSTMLSACGTKGSDAGSQANSSTAQASTEAQQTAAEERETIELTFFTEGAPGVNELKVAEVEKLFKIKLNTISTPTQEYDQKLNLVMASGEIPDIILFRNLTEMFSYAKQGALMQLDDLLAANAPNTMSYVQENLWPYIKVDEKIYTIPTERIPQKNNMYIRTDWLDNLGLSVPTTLDEYYNVMKAFVNDDPDGNNKKDTYGFGSSAAGSLGSIGTFSPIYGAYGVMDGGWYWDDASGQLLPYDINANMKEALAYIRKLYSEGLVLQDWLVINGAQADAYVDSGKLGMFYGFWTYGANRELKIKETNANAEVIAIAPPVGPTGLSGNRSSGYVGTRSYSLSVANKHAERSLEFLDYFHTTKGFMLGRYGLEGQHWNWKNGATTPDTVEALNKMVDQIEFTDLYNTDKDASTIEFLNLFQPQQDITLIPGWSEDHVTAQKFTRSQKLIFDESDGIQSDAKTKYSAALNTLRDETFTKIILGEYSLDKFDEYVTKWKAQGGDELIADMTKQYKAIKKK